MEAQKLIYWYPDLLLILVVDLLIAVVLLTAYRKIAGLISNVSSTHELSEKDNVAFGWVFGAGLLALAIVMTGAISGEAPSSLFYEIALVLAYGVVGIVLMLLTRKVFDNFTLTEINVHDQVMQGNLAVAIADIGNLLATAIIVRAVMVWIESTSFFGLVAVIIGFAVSQAVLIIVTKYRMRVYAKRHPGESLQKAIESGNKALALRYAGHKIGVALAVTAASGFVPYNPDNIIAVCLVWGGVSVVLTIILSLLAIAARHAILAKIDVVEEVDSQQNMGIGFIEATIYVAVGLLLTSLIA